MSDARPSFASDNTAGVDEAVLAALARVNGGPAPAYGDDAETARAVALLRHEFGPASEPFLVWGGTGANVLGLAQVLRAHEAVLCTEVAHIHVDECGAPERFAGCKLLAIPSTDGKLDPARLRARVGGHGAPHQVVPRVISVSQTTEYGAVYAPDELRAIAALAHAHGLLVHLDGARLANACAALGCRLADVTVHAGVDLLSFGLTKNGAMAAEAVIFLRPGLADGFGFRRKQGMQLASKMRFLAAQVVAMLEGERWRANAAHANAMAARLAAHARGVPGVRLTQPVQANAVFAILPRAATARLQEEFHFYTWSEPTGEVRWMTSFRTTAAEVDAFGRRLAEVCAAEAA